MRLQDHQSRTVQTVTQVTRDVKSMLEQSFSGVWVEGEIFGLKTPRSGHSYFTLKDAQAQISAVLFRGNAMRLRIALQEGMSVQCFGRLTLYEAQGRFQMVVEQVRVSGDGALLAALEALKRRLDQEGLFSAEHKQSLPFIPKAIGLVTSATGAAVHDVIRSVHDRFPAPILLYPSPVQGHEAPGGIVEALEFLDQHPDVDVIIVGRGGGSLEDLWAFNTEPVVRAIHECATPVVSAVGHEVDVLLSDFVADVRAPTPTGAAPLVVPVGRELRDHLQRLEDRMGRAVSGILESNAQDLDRLTHRIPEPHRLLDRHRIELRERIHRSHWGIRERLNGYSRTLQESTGALRMLHPSSALERHRRRQTIAVSHLRERIRESLNARRSKLEVLQARLVNLGPQQVLDRGYAIARSSSSGGAITDPSKLSTGEEVIIHVAKGLFRANVTR